MLKKYNRQKDPVISRAEARDFDSRAINNYGISGLVLMENAGRGCAELILKTLPRLEAEKVCILCGSGNNAGDGFVIARALHNAGIDVTIIICCNAKKIKGDARVNYDLVRLLKLPIHKFESVSGRPQRKLPAWQTTAACWSMPFSEPAFPACSERTTRSFSRQSTIFKSP